ncbi:MAG TPA: membrane protein insertion efficiency factor YidD [Candidatus Dietzia intestinipullorum]|nr:membrane protein insertion efficiency factor YidD [Candidatus Dietzia intestinipullorum]
MSEKRPGLVARVLLWMLDFYQKGISPLTPPSCRFEPTCSSYAVEAVRIHGALRGTGLAGWRLLRCGPWTRGGWDPVPEPRGPSGRDAATPDRNEHPDHS